MENRAVDRALIFVLRYLFNQKSALPPTSEISARYIGYGVYRNTDGSLWFKIKPGSDMTRIALYSDISGEGIPRVTTAQRIARPPVPHDLVLDIDLNRLMVFDGAWEEA